jgi:hypothetical protein
VTLGAALTGVVNLGAGTDELVLGDFANTVTVSNVETLTGGTSSDVVVLAQCGDVGQH